MSHSTTSDVNLPPQNRSVRRPIDIPGDRLEGGGQILRNSLCLSVLTHRPIHITSIRGNRPVPGLKAQHVAGVNALAMLSGGNIECLLMEGDQQVKGRGGKKINKKSSEPQEDLASKGAREIVFSPGTGMKKVTGGRKNTSALGSGNEKGKAMEIELDVGTNGAATLVLQAILPVLVFGAYENIPTTTPPATVAEESTPRKTSIVHITGGTNVSFSPSVEFLSLILFPTLSTHLRLPHVSISLEKRSWAGSSQVGKVRVEVEQLRQGEGIAGFTIEPDKKQGERVKKVTITVIVPTVEEIKVWTDVARKLVTDAKVDEWFVPPLPSSLAHQPKLGTTNTERTSKDEGTQLPTELGNLTLNTTNDEPQVEIEISSLTAATLPSDPNRANTQGYFAMIHTTSTPSGYLMAYECLHTASKKARLPALMLPLDNKRRSSTSHSKKPGQGSHHRAHKSKYKSGQVEESPSWPPRDDAHEDEDGKSTAADGDNDAKENIYMNTSISGEMTPELRTSQVLAKRLLKPIVARLQYQWAKGEVVDEYLRDQLVIWQAASTGWSYVSGGGGEEEGKLGGQEKEGDGDLEEEQKIIRDDNEDWGTGSLHTQTARWVAHEVLGVEWKGEGKSGCMGFGLRAN